MSERAEANQATSDSLKLALVSAGVCGLAWAGTLTKLGPEGQPAAYLLYYLWPVLSLVLAALTLAFGLREFRQGRRAVPALAILLAAGVAAFSWIAFSGWE